MLFFCGFLPYQDVYGTIYASIAMFSIVGTLLTMAAQIQALYDKAYKNNELSNKSHHRKNAYNSEVLNGIDFHNGLDEHDVDFNTSVTSCHSTSITDTSSATSSSSFTDSSSSSSSCD